ncbi:MAG: hypothetical protein HYZ72_19595, partial [Deltaproteobacteria bacterium]|nr:hypothetical protein [Deltaproteobacteria bacterium]
METREFWGTDMNEVLQAVRASLGADALILDTLSVPGADGTDGEERIKVTAMREELRPPTPTPQPPRSTSALREEGEAEGLKEISQQLADLKSMLCWMIPGMKQSGVLGELVTQDVPLDLLVRLIQEAAGAEGVDEREQIRRVLIRTIPTGGDVEARSEQRMCLALIGPPGTGKTSAVVKLTVHLTRSGERRVGWVSLDNCRVTGAEELTVYAWILGIPCEVAEGREGLIRALERLSACDLVLIDTAGVNPRDTAGLAELAGVLHIQGTPELRRTLVLSAATNGRDLQTWVERYGQVGFDSLLFTMVDACGHFGPL